MSRYFSGLLFSALFLIACEERVNTSKLTQELVHINEQQRIAHLTNDAALLASTIADTLVSIQNGSVTSASNIEVENKFSQYFAYVKYTTWDDTRPPIIELSSDGTLASVSVQKLLDLQQLDSSGIPGAHSYSLFAWTSLFKRVGQQWKMTQITSTTKALTEVEALNIPVHLSEDYTTLDERELIPEGITYDPSTEITYLSSTYLQKIVAIKPDGTQYDFKKEHQDGLWSTLGMEVDPVNQRLWVASFHGEEVLPLKNPSPENEWKARLYEYELPSGKLVNIHIPEIEGQFAFNDLCIDTKGNVYVTESVQNKVYHLDRQSSKFNALDIVDSLFVFPNGITISDDETLLYVSTTYGIGQYKLADGTFRFLNKPEAIKDNRIDGLAYYQGSLIANQPYRNRILQFRLNESEGKITSQRILESNHPDFDQPTTGEIAGNEYIYLANAQMRSGFEKGHLKPWEELSPVKILKVSLYPIE